ncbi:hypothetical protein SPD48_18445 [Pseudogracilibacillus sp. SE30717A]|uniref:hypothetical protein n=1 Tax=Pseudogracilibacillus sp. SE30717A TaxID=3098293 RepID=UPI00300DE7C6
MKSSSIYKHIYIFYAAVLIINLVNVFLELPFINLLLSICAIIMFLFAFVKATVVFKVLGIVFVSIGTFFYLTTSVSFADTIYVLKNNFPLLTLFMMLPWMNSVVRSGRYDSLLSKIMKVNTKELGTLYNRSSLATFSLATFLNLPAITISQSIIKSNLKTVPKRLRNQFINMASVRSYTMALLWSPLEILVAVGVFVTGVKYIQVLPWLLLVVVLIFIIDNLIGKIRYKKYPYREGGKARTFTKKDFKKISGLIGALVLFLVIIVVAGYFDKIDFIMTITLLILPFTFLWAIAIKRLRRFTVVGWNAWKNSTNGMHNFIVLFVSLALFSSAITDSDASTFIHGFIMKFSDSPLLLMIAIQLFILMMSLFGVHSIASIGILSGLMVPLMEIIEPISLALILIISSVSTFAVSTYGLLVTITSFNTEQNPYRITFDNIAFTLICGSLGTILAYLLM